MREVSSKTRRNLVIAGAAGLATLAAPKMLQSVVSPAQAANLKTQFLRREGAWNNFGGGDIVVPVEVENPHGAGTHPVVEEVEIGLHIDHNKVSVLEVYLTSPDGHTVKLVEPFYLRYYAAPECSVYGIKVTLIDNDWHYNNSPRLHYHSCPGSNQITNFWQRFVGKKDWERFFTGTYHTNGRVLRQFKWKQATGTWKVRVPYTHTGAVVRLVNLTVISRV